MTNDQTGGHGAIDTRCDRMTHYSQTMNTRGWSHPPVQGAKLSHPYQSLWRSESTVTDDLGAYLSSVDFTYPQSDGVALWGRFRNYAFYWEYF